MRRMKVGTVGQRIAHSPMSQWWHRFAGHKCFSFPGHMKVEEPCCSLKQDTSSLAKVKEKILVKTQSP